jgi:hypothetical protein
MANMSSSPFLYRTPLSEAQAEDMKSINLNDPQKHAITRLLESITGAIINLLKDRSHLISCKSLANGI